MSSTDYSRADSSGVSRAPKAVGPESIHPVFDVFPVAFVVALMLAVAHSFAKHARALDAGFDESAAGFRLVALSERWPEVLAEALIAAGVGAMALTYASAFRAKRGRGAAFLAVLGALVIAFVAAAAFITGWPSDTTRSPSLEAIPDAVSPFTMAALGSALGATLFMFGLVRFGIRGKVATVVAAALCLGGAFYGARALGEAQPGQPVSDVAVDVVATPAMWSVVESRRDAEPAPGVMTPIVDQTTDTGDKPSIVMPPPSLVEFVVPNEANGTRLMAAAGADQKLFNAAPKGLDVDYRILIDGEVVWQTHFEHRQASRDMSDTAKMSWRHVTDESNERGIRVKAGQVVRLETSIADGTDPDSLDGSLLQLGFGGVSLVRTGAVPRKVASPKHPNIVFIVMDTLRKDRVGCYGYDKNTTPNIDALAERGMRFEDAMACSSWTWPSTASLLTGLPPEAHGVKDSASCTLSQRFVTLPEALQRTGYTTAAFVGNPIVEPERYFDQGFESFDVETGAVFRMSDKVVPQALDWLDDHAPLRFFLYLHLVDPHTPHEPHPAEARRMKLGPAPASWPAAGMNGLRSELKPTPEVLAYTNDLYDASVATGDRYVGLVIDRLEALGLLESTIICFTSDHGEELFDHGDHGHGHALWSELVDAPLILAGPGIPRGERRAGAVSNRHVVPTLAALAGTELAPTADACLLHEQPMPDEAWFQTSKGKWGTARYQELLGLRQDALTTHWRSSDTAPGELARSDLRIFDALVDTDQAKDLIAVRASEARDAAKHLLELRREAAALRPPLILGVGEKGRATIDGMGYGPGDPGFEQK